MGAGTALAAPLLAGGRARAAPLADVDVVVIGAGISGLAAARALGGMGYEVVVLEARDRIGGRLYTDRGLGAPFEVGAGWIHGPDGNPISELARRAGGRTFVTDDDSFQVFRADGSPVPRGEVEQGWGRLERLFGRIDARFEPDLPLARAVQRVQPGARDDALLQWMLSAYTEFDTGGPLERLSAYYFDEDSAFDGADVVLTNGYDLVLKPLARGLDIRLGNRVTRIEYEEGDGASVYAGKARYDASFVICTLPLGVLKAGAVTFDPPLPRDHRNRISRLGMGNVTKLAMRFDAPYWPVDTQYFGLMTKERGRWNYFLNYRTFSDANILLGLSVGAYAGKVERLTDAAMLADGMKAVRRMFGSQVPAPNAHRLTRWSRDPFSLGAYSYSRVGATPADFDDLARPVAGTLLLAGEHTLFKYHATMHGAYLSGLRAARQVDDLA